MLIRLFTCVATISTITAQGWAAKQGDNAQVLQVVTDSQGDVYAVGYFYSSSFTVYDSFGGPFEAVTNSSGYHGFVVKYSANGNFQWLVHSGGSGQDQATGVVVDTVGNVIVAGFYSSSAPVIYDALGIQTTNALPNPSLQAGYVFKFSHSGKFMWAARLDGPFVDQVTDLAIDSMNNIIVVGSYSSSILTIYNSVLQASHQLPGTSLRNGFVVKFAGNGSFVWASRQSITPTTQSALAKAVQSDTLGNVLVAGDYQIGNVSIYDASGLKVKSLASTSTSGKYSGFVVKYASNGSLIWATYAGGTENTQMNSLSVDDQGSLYVTGQYSSLILNFYEAFGPGFGQLQQDLFIFGNTFLVKYHSNGSFLYAVRAISVAGSQANEVSTDLDGNAVTAGTYNSQLQIYDSQNRFQLTLPGNLGFSNSYVVKYSSNGSFLWATYQDGISDSYAQSVVVDLNGNVYAAGYYNYALTIYDSVGNNVGTLINNGPGTGGYLVKYNPNGLFNQQSSLVGLTSTNTPSSTLSSSYISTQTNSEITSSMTLPDFTQVASQQLNLDLPTRNTLLVSSIDTGSTKLGVLNSQSNGQLSFLWLWIVIGAVVLIVIAIIITLICCLTKSKESQKSPKVNEYNGNGTTMLEQSIPISNGTTMLNQTIPFQQDTTMTLSAITQQVPQVKIQEESYSKAYPKDQGKDAYLTQTE